MRRKLHLHLAALLACASILAWGPSASFAQGSTGGTLGKTDQSLSGGRPAESPDKGNSVKRSAPDKQSGDTSAADGLPRTMHLVERATGQEFRVQLTRTGAKTYEGTWNHGVTSRMTVTAFTKDQVVMQRTDIAGLFLVSGPYSGKRVGNRVPRGTTQLSHGVASWWEASW
jgi:hypothetical protein